MKKLAEINFEGATEREAALFAIRNTIRAVIFDETNNVALVNVAKDKFHKLPGGGIEDGEENIDALRRECKEETGVEITMPVELGSVTEIKKIDRMVQHSYCYVAGVAGNKNIPQFTPEEISRGFEVVWIPINDAIQLIESESHANLSGKYITERELAILKAAKEMGHAFR